MANLNRKNRYKLLLIFTLIVFCCIFPSAYIAAKELDHRICYGRYAKELGVEPTYEAISRKIMTYVDENIQIGMKRDQVISILKGIVPVAIHDEGTTLSGGHSEYTMTNICLFKANEIVLLIYYSSGNRLEEIRLYIDD